MHALNRSLLTSALFLAALAKTQAQPVITAQPQNQTNLVGATATFSVEATGTPLLTYQWRFNGLDQPGATDPALVITNVQPGDQGNYSVVVTNLEGSVTSILASLTVLVPPGIITQPADQTANQGYSASFSVRASGTPPLSPQWFFNSNAVTGETGTKLTITNAFPPNAGDYFVIVTNLAGSATSRAAKLTIVLPAALDSRISRNIRMGEDPSKLPPSNPSEAEIHLIRSPLDVQVLLATFQEARQPANGGLGIGYAVSRDGGLTWGRGLLPGLGPLFVSADTDNVADSVAAFDLTGRAYINSLDNNSGIVLSTSTNGAASFANPRIITAGTNPDKNWLTVNTYPNSPTANRLVMTWTEFDSSGSTISSDGSVFSDNGGASWSKPTFITHLPGTGTQPLFLPDGSLVLLSCDGYTRIQIASSPDGGQTYGTNRLVTNFVRYDDPRARARGFLPSTTTDGQAGIIYLTYQAQLGSGTNAHPAIMFTRSIDHGQTWTTPTAVNDTPNKRSVFTPAIAASPDGQHVLIEFYDRRNDNGSGYLVDLYLAESFDGGDTWEPNLRVSEFTTDMRKAPLTSSGGGGYFYGDYQAIVPSLDLDTPAVAAWIDARSSQNDPFAAQIRRTKGTTFETWRKLRFSTNELANLAVSGEAADPDGDGIPNLAEYALGLEPTHYDTSPIQVTTVRNRDFAGVRLTYSHLAVLGDIQFAWETCTDLVNWQPATPHNEAIEGTGFMRTQSADFVFEPTQKGFFRLTVRRTP